MKFIDLSASFLLLSRLQQLFKTLNGPKCPLAAPKIGIEKYLETKSVSKCAVKVNDSKRLKISLVWQSCLTVYMLQNEKHIKKQFVCPVRPFSLSSGEKL